MNTPTVEELSRRIEHVIEEHLVATRRAAAAAVERAFACSGVAPPRVRKQASRNVQPAQRRTPAELAKLGEQLYRAVCTSPGETMTVLAADVGTKPRELSLPMEQLKRTGRVRSTGQRHLTRYFPLVSETAESS